MKSTLIQAVIVCCIYVTVLHARELRHPESTTKTTLDAQGTAIRPAGAPSPVEPGTVTRRPVQQPPTPEGLGTAQEVLLLTTDKPATNPPYQVVQPPQQARRPLRIGRPKREAIEAKRMQPGVSLVRFVEKLKYPSARTAIDEANKAFKAMHNRVHSRMRLVLNEAFTDYFREIKRALTAAKNITIKKGYSDTYKESLESALKATEATITMLEGKPNRTMLLKGPWIKNLDQTLKDVDQKTLSTM